MHRLSNIAENSPVEVAVTLDSSRLTSSLFHVTCGVKICDVRARDPVSGELLLLVEENNVDYLQLSTDGTKPLRKKKPFLFVLVSCRAFKFKIRSPTTQMTVTYVFTIKIIIFDSIIKPVM